jgi:hypothetical protein
MKMKNPKEKRVMPPKCARIGVEIKTLFRGPAIGLGGVLNDMDVIKTGRVFQQVPDPHRIGSFPLVFEFDFRNDTGDRIAGFYKAIFRQHHYRNRHKALADGADPEHGFSGHGRVVAGIGQAEVQLAKIGIPVSEDNLKAWDVVGFHDSHQAVFERLKYPRIIRLGLAETQKKAKEDRC